MSDSHIEPPAPSDRVLVVADTDANDTIQTPAPQIAQAPSVQDLPLQNLLATAEPFAPSPPPPANINIFGEFDGVERRDVRTTGETGLQQHTFVTEGYDGDVSVDPTGKYIVFSSTRHSEHPQIYMQRVDGTSVIQLTNDSSDNAFPTFSPDGRQIAFCSTRAGNWDIYTMDLSGRNVVQVTSGPTQDIHPSFAPDCVRIAYCSLGGRSNQWELWAVNVETNEKRMIGYGLFPSWSPDRVTDRIAFQRARQRGSRWFSLWTMELIDYEARTVAEVAVSANAAIVSPSWSPDARKLAFATIVEPARTNGRGKPEGQQDIWTINADGSNRHRLTDGNGTNALPYWGADNRIYFISDRGGTECVWSTQSDAPQTKLVEKNPEFKPQAPGQPQPAPPAAAVGSTDTHETH